MLVNESQGVLNTAVNVTLTPIRTNTSIFVRGEKWCERDFNKSFGVLDYASIVNLFN